MSNACLNRNENISEMLLWLTFWIDFENCRETLETGKYYTGAKKTHARRLVPEVVYSDKSCMTVIQGQSRRVRGLKVLTPQASRAKKLARATFIMGFQL